MKKIDIHCHTTRRALTDLTVSSASLESIRLEMKEWNIEKTVVLASYFPHKMSGISNYRLYHWIKESPEFLLFGSLDVQHYLHQGINELEELAELGALKGIKFYTCYQQIDLASAQLQPVFKIAQRYKLPLMFHSGYSYTSMRQFQRVAIANLITPKDIEKVACRTTAPIIISHLAKPFLSELIEVVQRNPQISADMSGLLDSKYDRQEIPASIEAIRQYVQECGPERLLFGTDFPIQTHADSVMMLEQAMSGFSDEDKSKVYYQNARRMVP